MKHSLQGISWQAFLLLIAVAIIGVSLWYTNRLARDMAQREKQEAELWASAYKNIILAPESADVSFEFEVVRKNDRIPLILTDADGKVLNFRNIDSLKAARPGYLEKRIRKMKSQNTPIVLEISPEAKNFIYYEDSNLLRRLRIFPLVQLSIITGFLVFAYVLFTTARTAEQNQLWVGMAKETAHQLGTPISSLAAWLDLLRGKKYDDELKPVLDEIQKDIDRLELVADRFSKIGSAPGLQEAPLKPLLAKAVEYVRKRSSDQVKVELHAPEDATALLNAQLFDWVVENLLKNALDSMGGRGVISIHLIKDRNKIFIDVKDSGKGIPKSLFKTIFRPGFSTKKRGWGLGLALSKRIIEQYHKGKIFVKESELNKGTTFRIVLSSSDTGNT
ncbi:MAG: two-component sensor histidine kinase [Chitinophagales bacterium]|nr:MAG: two-component sensor histidine kinase [Chitinophagales bacterium]